MSLEEQHIDRKTDTTRLSHPFFFTQRRAIKSHHVCWSVCFLLLLVVGLSVVLKEDHAARSIMHSSVSCT